MRATYYDFADQEQSKKARMLECIPWSKASVFIHSIES